MKKSIAIMSITLLVLLFFPLDAEHFGQTHQQYIPFFLETYDFQTIRSGILQGTFSGMIPDPFADLSWNPAFINDTEKNSLYIDFHPGSSRHLPRYRTHLFSMELIRSKMKRPSEENRY